MNVIHYISDANTLGRKTPKHGNSRAFSGDL